MKAFAWVEPKSLDEALKAGAAPGALYKAGGIDVADRLKEHLEEPESLVNLRRLSELDFVRHTDDGLVLGPLVTLARLAEDANVNKLAPALAQATAGAATPQVRAMATLGGNLAQRPRCWYFRNELFPCLKKGGMVCFAIPGEHEGHGIFDNERCAAVHASGAATALRALGATLVLQSAAKKREVPIDAFFVAPSVDVTRENVLEKGELIVEIRVPARASSYVKLMQKQSFDWPMVDAACALQVEGGVVKKAGVTIGAVSYAPRRCAEVEAALVGKRLDAQAAEAAARLAANAATPLKHNGHKVQLARAAVRQAIFNAGGLS